MFASSKIENIREYLILNDIRKKCALRISEGNWSNQRNSKGSGDIGNQNPWGGRASLEQQQKVI